MIQKGDAGKASNDKDRDVKLTTHSAKKKINREIVVFFSSVSNWRKWPLSISEDCHFKLLGRLSKICLQMQEMPEVFMLPSNLATQIYLFIQSTENKCCTHYNKYIYTHTPSCNMNLCPECDYNFRNHLVPQNEISRRPRAKFVYQYAHSLCQQ